MFESMLVLCSCDKATLDEEDGYTATATADSSLSSEDQSRLHFQQNLKHLNKDKHQVIVEHVLPRPEANVNDNVGTNTQKQLHEDNHPVIIEHSLPRLEATANDNVNIHIQKKLHLDNKQQIFPRLEATANEKNFFYHAEYSNHHQEERIPSQLLLNQEHIKRHEDEEGMSEFSEEVKEDQETNPFSDECSESRDGSVSSHSTKLKELRKRNMAIGLKRREEIANARKLRQKGPLKYVSPKVPNLTQNENCSSSNLTSRILSPMFMNGNVINFHYKEHRTERLNSPSTDNVSCSGSSRSSMTSLSSFAERNRLIAAKRKEAMAKARSKANEKRSLPSRSNKYYQKMRETREETSQERFHRLYEQGKSRNRAVLAQLSQSINQNESQSLSSRVSKLKRMDEKNTHSSSSKSLSRRDGKGLSRLDSLYESGKQKNRHDLHRYTQDKQESSESSTKSVTRTRAKVDLNERRKRNLEAGIKRREEMSKARAASTPKPRTLPQQKGTYFSYNATNRNISLQQRLYQVYATE